VVTLVESLSEDRVPHQLFHYSVHLVVRPAAVDAVHLTVPESLDGGFVDNLQDDVHMTGITHRRQFANTVESPPHDVVHRSEDGAHRYQDA